MRSSELLRRLPNLSQKVLTAQLRELEKDDIITRKVFNEIPPHVEYELSAYGQTLTPILYLLCTWGEQNVGHRRHQSEDVTILNYE